MTVRQRFCSATGIRAPPGVGRSTDISIECSADACLFGLFRGRRGQQLYTLRCIFVARRVTTNDAVTNAGPRVPGRDDRNGRIHAIRNVCYLSG